MTGGFDGANILSSTELLVAGYWTVSSISELPLALLGAKAVNLDNAVFLSGIVLDWKPLTLFIWSYLVGFCAAMQR